MLGSSSLSGSSGLSSIDFPSQGSFKVATRRSIADSPDQLFPAASNVEVVLRCKSNGIRAYLTFAGGAKQPLGYRTQDCELVLLSGSFTVSNPRTKQTDAVVDQVGSIAMLAKNTPHSLSFLKPTVVLFIASSSANLPYWRSSIQHDVEIE